MVKCDRCPGRMLPGSIVGPGNLQNACISADLTRMAIWLQMHAGKVAAEKYGAEVVDPRPYFVGTLKSTLDKYPHIGTTIPAMGYSPQQACLCHHTQKLPGHRAGEICTQALPQHEHMPGVFHAEDRQRCTACQSHVSAVLLGGLSCHAARCMATARQVPHALSRAIQLL
jgi:hypothetical protein